MAMASEPTVGAGRFKKETGTKEPNLADRLTAVLEGSTNDMEEGVAELLLSVKRRQPIQELANLLQSCVEQQVLLRRWYCSSLGQLFLSAMIQLSKARHAAWQVVLASLRLLEGVLLICAVPDEGAHLCNALNELMRTRFLPRQAGARLESVAMSLADPSIRNLYAANPLPSWTVAPGSDRVRSIGAAMVEEELQTMAATLRMLRATERQRCLVLDIFDEAIFRHFGVHGQPFGSAVNGFQTRSSDIDIQVLLPPEVLEKLVADGKQMAMASNRRGKREACAAAVRSLAEALRSLDFTVVDVIEGARVPIVKCKHSLTQKQLEEAVAEGGFDEEDVVAGPMTPITFEVDISFCNEVASFNSRLLRAYADLDQRAVTLCVLVKHWSRQRRLNIPLEGTLSSYSYTLLVIHYLQRKGLLPNLQQPRPEVLERLGLIAPDSGSCSESHRKPQHLIEGGHDVWFLSPDSVAPAGDTESVAASGITSAADVDRASLAKDKEWMLGKPDPQAGILELLYGFFRYFAIEFNFYADVISIRQYEEKPKRKIDFFQEAVADDGPEGRNAEASEEEEEEEVRNEMVEEEEEEEAGHMEEGGDEADASSDYLQPGLAEEGACSVGGQAPRVVDKGACDNLQSETDELHAAPPSSCSSDQGDEVVFSRPNLLADEVTEIVDPILQRHTGVVRSFNPDHGFGFITCQSTYEVYRRDVFLHQKQAKDVSSPGEKVSFIVELNAKGHPQARQVRRASDAEEEPHQSRVLHSQQLPSEAATDVQARADAQARAVADRARLLAQRRLRDRQCLCIEDPMERNRTLGTSFTGQELLSHELLRALSLLKRGPTDLVKELFKEVPVSRRKRSGQAEKREYSPVPVQSMDDSGMLHVQLNRSVPDKFVGRIIGEAGTNINHLKAANNLEDIWIDKQSDVRQDKLVVLKGEPANVANAWARVEDIMGSSHFVNPPGAAQGKGRTARRGTQQRQRMAIPSTATSRAGCSAAIGAGRPVGNGVAAASSSSTGPTYKSPPLEKVLNSFGPPSAAAPMAEVASSSTRSPATKESYYPTPTRSKDIKHKGNKITQPVSDSASVASSWYKFQ